MTDTYARGLAGFTLSTADWAALRDEFVAVEAAIEANKLENGGDGRKIFEEGLIVDLYNSLLSRIPSPGSAGAPVGEVYEASWTWINGAAGVNGRTNFNGVFIHEITKKQYVLRFGEDGTNLDNFVSDSKVSHAQQCLARRRMRIRMWAIKAHAVELAIDVSQSFVSRRHRPSQANVRSTTQRRGRTLKPLVSSQRRMTSMVQPPLPFNARFSLSPA